MYMEKVDWDFSKLRQETNVRISNKMAQEGQENQNTSYSNALRVIEKYPELKNNILDKHHDFMLGMGITTNFTITTSWITSIGKGDGCFLHRHKNCAYSGLLYFDEDYTNAAPLEFRNPLIHNDSFMFGFGDQPNPFTGNFQCPPETGKLIIFPSYIEHIVENNQSEHIRKSLAFNFHPIGFIGNGDSSLNTRWLNL